MNKKENDEKIKNQKSIEIFNSFLKNLPQDKIKFDEFSMLEEITNAKIDYNSMKHILKNKLNKIKDEPIREIKDI